MNRNGRSILNSTGVFSTRTAIQELVVSAVAAAASEPKSNDRHLLSDI